MLSCLARREVQAQQVALSCFCVFAPASLATRSALSPPLAPLLFCPAMAAEGHHVEAVAGVEGGEGDAPAVAPFDPIGHAQAILAGVGDMGGNRILLLEAQRRAIAAQKAQVVKELRSETRKRARLVEKAKGLTGGLGGARQGQSQGRGEAKGQGQGKGGSLSVSALGAPGLTGPALLCVLSQAASARFVYFRLGTKVRFKHGCVSLSLRPTRPWSPRRPLGTWCRALRPRAAVVVVWL